MNINNLFYGSARTAVQQFFLQSVNFFLLAAVSVVVASIRLGLL